ncbi:MAG TPA: hypothetical protein VFZ16_09630 [Hyphomicrobiaceae bacterium]|nr:hypothetical protein [Hyphomicrobiaceae bacterium]
MLEGLDQVPWRQLHHAFGTAEDVPALIRALASTEESERSSAFYELHGNLWHQGTIYEATPHAVPFLIDLATAQEIPGRSELLSYLGMLAGGSSYTDVHRGIAKPQNAAFRRQLQRELAWVAQTRRAVKAGEALYSACLKAAEHATCCAAAYVLSRFPEHADAYWAPIVRCYETAGTDTAVRCGIAILTQEFSVQGGSDTQWLLQMFDSEDHLAVRIALAVSLAHCPAQPAEAVLSFLGGNLLVGEEVSEMYHAQPWNSGEPIWDMVRALSLSRPGRRLAVDRFNALLSQGAPKDKLNYLRYVMRGELPLRATPLDMSTEPLLPIRLADE